MYQHKTTLALESVLCEALGSAHRAGFKVRGRTMLEALEPGAEEAFLLLDDSVERLIACADPSDYAAGQPRQDLVRAQRLLRDLELRRQPKLVLYQEHRSADEVGRLSRLEPQLLRLIAEKMAADPTEKMEAFRPDDFHVKVAKLSFGGAGGRDPRDDALFLVPDAGGRTVARWGRHLDLRQRVCEYGVLYVYKVPSIVWSCN